jgi:hypothetical protein
MDRTDFGQSERGNSLLRWLGLGTLTVVAFLLVYISTRSNGLGITVDSVSYLAAARSAASGAGFEDYDRTPLRLWPPGCSATLALVSMLTGQDPLDIASTVNSVFYAATVLLSFVLLTRTVSGQYFRLLGAIAILFAVPVQWAATYLWSEVQFDLCVAIFLLAATEFWAAGSLRCLAVAALAAFGACATRYVGVTVVATGVLLILLSQRGSLGHRLRLAGLFGAISVSPILIWGVRNYLLAGEASGERHFALRSLSDNLAIVYTTISHWLIPNRLPLSGAMRGCVFAAASLALIAIAVIIATRYREAGRAILKTVAPTIVFAAIYLVFMVVVASLVDFGILDDRLAGPLYIPGIISILAVLDQVRQLPTKSLSLVAKAFAVACTVWLAFPVSVVCMSVLHGYPPAVPDIASPLLRDSSLVQRLKGFSSEEVANLYTNRPKLIWFYTGTAPRVIPIPPTSDDSKSMVGHRLVWFRRSVDQAEFKLLTDHLTLEPRESLDLGDIFQVEQVSAPGSRPGGGGIGIEDAGR